MKKSKIYSLLACVCLLMQSCLFSEEDVFDQSSAQRAMESVEECNNLLQSSSNGWLMEYYPGYSLEDFGGFNLLAKFDGGNVVLASEIATANYAVGETCTSLYKVSSFQGTQLSFDGYNELIHSFCEPEGYNAPGFAGDYEFIFRTISKDKLILTGKKNGNMLVMTRLPEDADWSVMLSNINNIQTNAPYATYTLKIDGTEVTKFIRSNHTLTVTTRDEQGQPHTVSYPYIYTSEGIRMAEPMEFNNVSMTEFSWDNEKRSFICTDEGVNAEVEFYCPENYPKYLGRYRIKYGSTQRTVTLSQKIEGLTYTLSGMPNYNWEVQYNLNTECLEIQYQYLGTYGPYKVYLCPWDSQAGYLTWAEGTGLSGIITSESPMRIAFKDNGVYETADSFLYYAFNGSPSGTTTAGSVLQIPTPTLEKID
ncbi:DUF4302 domain-containing protein [Bacteroides caecimuris]|jgi:hypothetical protein|uniref:DUF4302 domain-containing protein n=1 Tax=Bacteroides caecimuris TaxID=1796613 RepID=UPI001C3C7237|nr:DUF4302 domain-containing protein [Bacteroides caecimuris]